MSFTRFQFSSQIAANISRCGYERPTPIQEQAMPEVLAGRDVLGLAQTGTGKTAAFALPLIQRLVDGPRGKVRALVVAPTRELAEQIDQNFQQLAQNTGLRSVTVYGGVGKGGQIQKFKRGVEVVIACPGRLLDHLNSRDLDLGAVESLVLDEADQMFDMGFFPDIRRILKFLPQKRQTLLFSATMPADIRRLADETLTNPVEVRINLEKPLETISQSLYPVAKKRKAELLLRLLSEGDHGSTLIFTRTKYAAKNLAKKLGAVGHRAVDLQGNMSQGQRQRALNGFREGEFTVLVATDIAARGIDVSLVGRVINYDMPSTAEAYTHRIGRTGRAGGAGCAVNFIGHDDKPLLRTIERLQGTVIQECLLDDFDHSFDPEEQAEPKKTAKSNNRNRRSPSAPAGKSAAPKRQGQQSGRPAKGKSPASAKRGGAGRKRAATKANVFGLR